MRLYYSPGACSLAAHIVTLEAGIEVELVKVDLKTKRTEDNTDFLAINPKGAVPALVLDNGEVLTEGVAIIQFIADSASKADLMPAVGTMERFRALEWLNFIATELHKGFSPLWRTDTPEEMRKIVRSVLATKFSLLDDHLRSRSHLLNSGFSAADAYAFTILSWASFLGFDLAQWPAVAGYVKRISSRPHVKAALAAEGLLMRERA